MINAKPQKPLNPAKTNPNPINILMVKNVVDTPYPNRLNVKINAASYSDKKYVARKLKKGKEILDKAKEMERKVLGIVERKIGKS